MKRLCLIRHAKSSKDDPSLPDKVRPLNKRGKKEAPLMGKRLKKLAIMPQAIYSSPAKRALGTAKIIAKKLKFPLKKIKLVDSMYYSNIPKLLKVIKKIDDSVDVAFLFGHNPEFTGLANYLTPRAIENVLTCGVLCVDYKLDSWKKVRRKKGRVAFFGSPGLK